MKIDVCVDLDGTICSDKEGWQGPTHFGELIPGAKEFMEELHKFANIIIFSCRTSESVCRGYKREYLVKLVEDWLNKNNIPFDLVYADQGKPVCRYFIDDRAIYCDPQRHENSFKLSLETVKYLAKK